jgi:hypothetical protein
VKDGSGALYDFEAKTIKAKQPDQTDKRRSSKTQNTLIITEIQA